MKTVKQILSIIISYSLVVLPLNAADIQVDSSTQTTLDTAKNGVPIVNIANPNSSGLSHNRFTNYNVTNKGVILNNSANTVSTQLSGYIYGNSNLSSNAKVILNEVTSTNRTTLGGYTEVAGKKADLVIANPNGITINGAGFINTSNVTLTTGSPIINNGQLSSFNIQGGDISIQGDGLDASEQDSAHLYSYYLTLNAAIHAKDLDIKLGQNNIDFTTKQITSHTDMGTATLLLDSSALGGMYADRITLIGTDKGIGVNLPPEVLASNGDIYITNDGTIELQKMTATNIDISSNKDINLNNNTYASDTTKLHATNNITTNSGMIISKNTLNLTSKNISNQATLIAGINEDTTQNNTGIVNIQSDNLINNGSIESTNTVDVQSDTITNNANILGLNTLSLKALTSLNNTNGNILSDNTVNITSFNTINNKFGTIKSNGNIILSSATNIDNTNGNIKAINDSSITTGTITLLNSNIFTGNNQYLKLNALDNIATSSIGAINNLTIEASDYITNSANLLSNGTIKLITNGILTNHSTISGNALDIEANSLTNDATISGGSGSSFLAITNDINNNSRISGAGDLTVTAMDITNDGYFNSGNDLTLAATNNLINNKTLFASNDMNLYVANKLQNNENANIFAINDLTMSADSSNTKTNLIKNYKATIQTYNGDIDIYANDLENSTEHPLIKTNYSTSGFTQIWTDELDTKYKQAELLSGNNLNLYVNNTLNSYSLISANNDIYFNSNTLNVDSIDLIKKTVSDPCAGLLLAVLCTGPTSTSTEVIDTIYSTVQAGKSVTGYVGSVKNGSIKENQTITNSTVINADTDTVTIPNTDGSTESISIPKDEYGLFVKSTDPLSSYLIETNPEFTLYENFIGSDYLLNSIDYDAELTTKKLGDAFYENTLIRDSIFEQTGKRFLNNVIKTDYDQYKYLMDNALQVYQDLKLTPGISLTAAQINALTKDIVWIEEKEVEGEKVLVPVVYIANTKKYKLQGAQIIAGDDIDLKVAALKNSGTMRAGSNFLVDASDTIENYGGNIEANDRLSLKAEKDITNTSGEIKAKNIDLTSSNGNIVNQRYTQLIDNSRLGLVIDKQTSIGNAGVIQASNVLNIDAKNAEVKIEGSELQAKDINLNAKSINITTTEKKKDFFAGDSSGYVKENSLTNLSSNLNADNININSEGTTTVKGSNLTAKDNININADKLNVLAVNDSDYKEMHSSSKGLLSSSSTTTKKATSTNIASTLDASNINLSTNAGDINIAGSKLHAQDTLALNSADNINVQAGYDGTMNEVHKESSGFFSGGNLYSQSEDLEGKLTKTAVNSDLSAKNIELNSKNDLTMVGADLQADESLSASASDISVQNATNEEQTYSKHTKLSIGVGEMAKSIMLPTENLNYDNGKVSIMLAKGEYDKNTKVTTKTTVAASNIDAKNITLNAASENQDSGNILIKGSNLAAQENLDLTASNNVDIQEAKETTTTDSSSVHGEAKLNFTVKNEFVQIGYAVDDATKAAEALKKTQSDYEKYKKDLSSQENKLSQLKTDLKNKKLGIEQSDVDEMQKYVDDLKDDDAYYKANIALATTTLATKLAAVAAQGSKAASSAGSFGFNAGVELDIDAIEKKLREYKEKSVASNLSADNINITANNKATVQGSNLQAANDININAKNTDILASTDISNADTSSNHQNITTSYEMYGGVNSNISEDGSKSSSTQATHTNSVLLANNININTAEDTNIKGGTVQADDTLTLNTKNLNVSSVQDTTASNSDSQSMSMGFSGFTPSSVGGSVSLSNSDSKDTLLTSLTANKVDITAQEDTTLKGATIAAVDTDGNDNGQLTLKTDTLHVSSLNNTLNSKSISAGGNIGGSIQDNTASNVSLDYSNDTTHSKTKTLATLGSGDIQVADTTDSDTAMLNRDIKDNTVDIYDISSHQGLSGELDTRLLTSDGRKQIAEDLLKSGMILNSVKLIVKSDKVGVTDFFNETDKSNKTYEAVKEKISSSPELAAALNDPNLTPSQKEQMLNSVTDAVMVKLGYAIYDNKMMDTNEPGKDGEQIKGYYSDQTNDAYINDRHNDSTTELLTTAGHEMSHAIDARAGVATDETYADIYGSNLADYTDFALYYTDQGSLATTNSHNTGQVTSYPSVFNDNTYATNNAEFSSLDKSQGDNEKIETITYSGKKDGDFILLQRNVAVRYETTLPEKFSRALEYPEFREKMKSEALNAASLGVAVAGGFATGGTAWFLWGTGAALDGYSIYQNNMDLSYGLGSLTPPPTGKVGTIWSIGNAINNGYIRNK